MIKFKCLCCDQLVLDFPPSGDYSICPVCGWEDDPVQTDDPYFSGGANKQSLSEARKRWVDDKNE